jgi:hypothetical protein
MVFVRILVSTLCVKAGFLPIPCSLPLPSSPAQLRERARVRVLTFSSICGGDYRQEAACEDFFSSQFGHGVFIG